MPKSTSKSKLTAPKALCEECNRPNIELLWHESVRRHEDILNLQKGLRHKARTLTFTVIGASFALIIQSGLELKDFTFTALSVPVGLLILVIIGLLFYIELPKLVSRGEFEIENEVFSAKITGTLSNQEISNLTLSAFKATQVYERLVDSLHNLYILMMILSITEVALVAIKALNLMHP